jgi:hypothetical protein
VKISVDKWFPLSHIYHKELKFLENLPKNTNGAIGPEYTLRTGSSPSFSENDFNNKRVNDDTKQDINHD